MSVSTFWQNAAHAANVHLGDEARQMLRLLAQDEAPNDVAVRYLADMGERLDRSIGRPAAEAAVNDAALVIGFVTPFLVFAMKQHAAANPEEKVADLLGYFCRRIEMRAKEAGE